MTTRVRQGCKPWLPTPTSSGVVAAHSYDVPLLGTYADGGDRHLFNCVWATASTA